jgi:hypothetical protein
MVAEAAYQRGEKYSMNAVSMKNEFDRQKQYRIAISYYDDAVAILGHYVKVNPNDSDVDLLFRRAMLARISVMTISSEIKETRVPSHIRYFSYDIWFPPSDQNHN